MRDVACVIDNVMLKVRQLELGASAATFQHAGSDSSQVLSFNLNIALE